MSYSFSNPYADNEPANGTLLLARGFDSKTITPNSTRMGYSCAGIIGFGKLCLCYCNLEVEKVGGVWFRRFGSRDLSDQFNWSWDSSRHAWAYRRSNSRISPTPNLAPNGLAATSNTTETGINFGQDAYSGDVDRVFRVMPITQTGHGDHQSGERWLDRKS
jgi:hypothetical protein